ncbi:hypothetical protein RI129_000832 [Pyrocoelia pectoralis]|uniref:OTU domain-containing protein n=1 Tax=Pyrocoelia pectoralis TaxID=417401 RepID=A0AAN7VTY1_9COLE
MASKFSKRGRNPGAIDSWLDSLGYYRKNVAYDETCLFRSVAEQLFNSQLYHERVRKECIIYGEKNVEEFLLYFPSKQEWWDRLMKLDLHMQICSDVEIQLICNTYGIDVSVLNANNHSIMDFHCSNIKLIGKTIRLCKMNEDHYDSVYTKQYITDAGFCQSIAYNLLYQNVFEIPNVSSIVNAMLHEKQAVYTVFNCEDLSMKDEYFGDDEVDSDDKLALGNLPQPCVVAPFPFKVAKALDPNMYRNIEYDTWLEVRRAMRLGDWYYGGDKLILGTRCNVDVNGLLEPCYIQEMLKDNKCIVYITTLAQRRTVKYCDLKPEDNAKPWPLPFRFIRKLPLQPSTNIIRCENEVNLKKRRERTRTNNSNNVKTTTVDNANDIKSLDYQGCNLVTSSQADNFYCNYDPDIHIQMPVWIPPSYTQPPDSVDNPYTPPTLLTPPISTPSPTLVQFNPFMNDRIICSNPVPPITPHVEPYSFMYPVQPHTPPFFYSYPTHPPTYPTVATRPPDSITSPLPVYNNPPDVQYSPPAYIYSPQAPSVPWFPPNVNTQGFIFPAPHN